MNHGDCRDDHRIDYRADRRDERSRENGVALPLVLGTILILSLFVLAALAAIQAPTNLLGKQGQREEDRIKAESRLERARAFLLTDLTEDLATIGVESTWSTTDSCLLAVSTTEGDIMIHESWIVTAPTRFTIYADSGIILSGDAEIEGLIHDGTEGDLCDTAPIDTTSFLPLITRRITAAEIDGLRVSHEVVEITPEDSTVTLSNIEIDHGMILVKGNVILAGRFEGVANDNLPLMIVTGSIGSIAHEEKWEWQGTIGAEKDAFLAGPIDFTGTITAKSVEFFGTVQGKSGSTEPTLGFIPRITRRAYQAR